MDIQITFNGQLNESIQIGDTVYYTPTQASGGFNTSNTSSAVLLGPVINLLEEEDGSSYSVTVRYNGSPAPTIPANSFYMFLKDNTVNLASVLGYYAEVQFVNNSTVKSEMFSVGSNTQFNSK